MSGERVVFADGADGHVADLVRAAGLVAEHAGVPIALIGGLSALDPWLRRAAWVEVLTDDALAEVAAEVVEGLSAR